MHTQVVKSIKQVIQVFSGEGKWNRTGGDAKTQPLCISAKLNLKHKILGEVKKKSFIALPVKGGHSRLMLLKPCVPMWGR